MLLVDHTFFRSVTVKSILYEICNSKAIICKYNNATCLYPCFDRYIGGRHLCINIVTKEWSPWIVNNTLYRNCSLACAYVHVEIYCNNCDSSNSIWFKDDLHAKQMTCIIYQ